MATLAEKVAEHTMHSHLGAIYRSGFGPTPARRCLTVLGLVMMLYGVSLPAQSMGGASPRQYLRLTLATIENPVTSEELKAAILSESGIASIRKQFEQSIRASLWLGETMVAPELGGESTISSGAIQLNAYDDPVHPVIRDAYEHRFKPSALLDLLQSSTEGTRVLEKTGGLHALLYQLTTLQDRQQAPTKEQLSLLIRVVESTVETYFKTWTVDPSTQLAGIARHEWQGRYAGFWHIHPPRFRGDAFSEGLEPSPPDLSNAVELGQFLTIVFQPQGFDAYDLSSLAASGTADLTKAQVVRFRSPTWNMGFQALVQRIREKAVR